MREEMVSNRGLERNENVVPFPLIISFWSFPLKLCGHSHSCVERSALSICISHTDDVGHRVWGAACGMSGCSQEPGFRVFCPVFTLIVVLILQTQAVCLLGKWRMCSQASNADNYPSSSLHFS